MSDLYTERVLTAATHAGAKAIYDQNVKMNRQLASGDGFELLEPPTWEDVNERTRSAIIDAAIPIVWAALNAVPDGRWAIWQQGHDDGAYGLTDCRRHCKCENPYPPPRFDIGDLNT